MLRAFGGSLGVEDIAAPAPGPGEVRVRVAAVSVNRTIDTAVLAGAWPAPVALPHVPGIDPVGIIDALGADVTGLREGDRVAVGTARCGQCPPCRDGHDAHCQRARMVGVARWGGMADAVIATATALAPAAAAWPDALVAMRHGGLALHMLRSRATVQAGETVLVTGAGGALAQCAIQLAAHLGARVIAAASDPARAQAALELGAHEARTYDTLGDLAADIVIETTGRAAAWTAAYHALAHGGRLVGSAASGPPPALDLRRLYTRRLSLYGAGLGSTADHREALELAAAGILRAVVHATYPLAEAATAIAAAAHTGVRGKILIAPGDLA